MTSLDSWTVNNNARFLSFNRNTKVNFASSPPTQYLDNISFISTEKRIIPPGGVIKINTRATGPHLFPLRPITMISTINEGSGDLEERVGVEIIPSVVNLSHNNCTTPFVVINNSNSSKTIKRGCVIAKSTDKYKTIESDDKHSSVNMISDNKHFHDVIRKKLAHLSTDRQIEVKNLVLEFQDIFTISKDKIGKANITEFDIDTSRIDPVAVPLRRLPVHHR